MESVQRRHRLTYPEYETLEGQSETRYEFDAGQVYAMAGGTINHNRLTRRVANLLEAEPSLKRGFVLTENVKVEALCHTSYRYPDVVVACHPFDLRGNNELSGSPD